MGAGRWSRLVAVVGGLGLALTSAGTGRPVRAQSNADWPQHNLDLRGGRYSPLNQINTSNVGSLALKWSYELAGDNIAQVTPLVVDGVMYFNAGSRLLAVNGTTGQVLWDVRVEPAFPGTGRGPAYANGRIYSYGRSVLYAVDAKTGRIVDSFGNKGRLLIADLAVRFKYPDRDPTGYQMVAPPAYFNGTLYVGLAQSEGHIPGGLVVAIDAATGAIKWVFSTVPQSAKDDAWELTKDTWIGGVRAGGGMWTQPAIDPDLGLIYINAGNPSPDYEGTARKGINLFTNSILALNLHTGKLVWHYQTIHHDLWDWDLVTGPILFDVNLGARTIKGVGSGGKNCFLYLFNRENGKPINPIVEMAVPTASDVPGEAAWPTQPFPHTSKGVPMQPFCSTFPIISDPELAKRARQMFFPYSMKELFIVSHGGGSFGSPAFSPRTGLLYVTGKNAAISFLVKVVGDKLRPDSTPIGHTATMGQRDNNTGVTPTETVTAYNPATGEVAWQEEHPSRTNIGSAGNLATAGDVVFQGSDTGDFYGLDARSGRQLFKYSSPKGIRASPLTYQVNGKQYVAVVATSSILTFGLP